MKFGILFFLEDLLDNLSKLDKRDVVYLLVLNRDKSGRFISSSWALGEITKTCPSPIYASWGFYLNRGIVGGNIIDGQLHGKYAAEIAKKILEDKNFKYQGLVKDNISNYIFDYKKLKKYGISLKLLPKGSIIINKSGGFFQKNYELLVRILIIMIAVVLFLIVRIMIKRKTEKELKQKVLQRTAELEKINKKLKKMAIIDDLTEIYNRRFILERLDFELKKCERYKKKLSLIMVDIDFFKSVNDKHGHLVGDKVLNRVARELQDNIREIDLVGRYGGEEFLIILTEAGRSFAKRIAERIRRKIEAIKFDEFSDSITISCGVAEVLVYNKDQVIKCVDSLLYQAKDKGRNRIVFN